MVSVEWVKSRIHEEWVEALPDRYDPAKAAKDVDREGVIRNYESSYDMHHKIVEARPQEIKALIKRQEKAEQGLIVWDEKEGRLRELDEEPS